jgi:hypothetical protein
VDDDDDSGCCDEKDAGHVQLHGRAPLPPSEAAGWCGDPAMDDDDKRSSTDCQ